jgi:hypothetical protein
MPAHGGLELAVKVRVGVEWVEKFHQNACNQNDLSYTHSQAEGFYNHMGSHGHTKVFDWGNDNAWETDFRHPAFGGDALNWSDDVHFCFFDSHGGNNNNMLSLSYAIQHANCSAVSTQWRLGSKRLKWIIFAGCESVLNHNAGHVLAVWGGPMRGVHIVCGYLGDSKDGWWSRNLGEDVADDICGGDSIAGSWCDRAYSFWLGDKSIAIAAGASQSEAINRREHETLNWRDSNVASTNWLAWKWRT